MLDIVSKGQTELAQGNRISNQWDGDLRFWGNLEMRLEYLTRTIHSVTRRRHYVINVFEIRNRRLQRNSNFDQRHMLRTWWGIT